VASTSFDKGSQNISREKAGYDQSPNLAGGLGGKDYAQKCENAEYEESRPREGKEWKWRGCFDGRGNLKREARCRRHRGRLFNVFSHGGRQPGHSKREEGECQGPSIKQKRKGGTVSARRGKWVYHPYCSFSTLAGADDSRVREREKNKEERRNLQDEKEKE